MIEQLSITQAERFDHAQTGGCQLRWWFENVNSIWADKTHANEDGISGHAILAHWFKTGQRWPTKRQKMLKAVNAAIAKGELPVPGPDMQVEWRFDGQADKDAEGNRIPLDREKTFWLAGIPWDGFVDLRYRRSDVVTVMDHKFSSDINHPGWSKRGKDLINTIQMPVYALESLRTWPDATKFELVHHYVQRTGVDSDIRPAVVTLDQILERKEQIEGLVAEMKQVETATRQEDVPFNRKACHAWMGCPHQSICKAFKENKMALSDDELACFGGPSKGPTLAASQAEMLKDVPPPPAPKRTMEIWPACKDCGTDLNPDIASKLQNGTFVHIGCSAQAVVTPKEEPKPKRAKKEIPTSDLVMRNETVEVRPIPLAQPGTTVIKPLPLAKKDPVILPPDRPTSQSVSSPVQFTVNPGFTKRDLARALRAAADALEQP